MATNIVTDQAGHLDERWRRLIETVRRGMAADDGLRYLAHFTDGIYNFGMGPVPVPDEERDGAQGEFERYRRIGRRLNEVAETADSWLRPLDSGELIRLVFASERGAILHFGVRPHEYLVGVARGADRIETADRQLAKISEDVRALLALGPKNPGGYQPLPDRLDAPARSELRVVGADESGRAFAELHRRHVSHTDLHYLATYVGDRLVSEVDAFDDPGVDEFFIGATPDSRRSRYADIVRRVNVLARRLGFQMRALLDGNLTRIVLDVEQGALYYRVLPDDVVMLGVTLDQRMVWEAEQRMNKVIAEQFGGDRP
ncbi:hypothetical protein [Actinomadura chibensis]|uniref:Uncharacterized protein n=1 Tax=Actinomadura chibensis TaxID=392828 RepID=A0A5D0NM22_9ACTN|nr:hypothetical protein [Actinomadura chibensis]TYB45546.1 hypothetical protein FXF69_19150 [Actinomadura chibensis]